MKKHRVMTGICFIGFLQGAIAAMPLPDPTVHWSAADLTRALESMREHDSDASWAGWGEAFTVIADPTQHPRARGLLAERVRAAALPGKHVQLIARCAEIAGDPHDPQGHLIVLATLGWLAQPENAALLNTPEAAALASALIANNVFSPGAFGSLDTLLMSAPMTAEQRSALAFRCIVKQRATAGVLGSDVPLALLPAELDSLQRMVAGWGGLPENFPWTALDALVAAEHQPVLPLVKELERRAAPKPDRGSQLVHHALRQGALLLEAGHDPARLLAVGARIDISALHRHWAFVRAHDLGATNDQIRAAIETLHRAALDQARAQNLNARETKVWVSGPMVEVVTFAKRIGALDQDAYPDLITFPSHMLHGCH